MDHPSREEWMAYLYGELDRSSEAVLTAHLEGVVTPSVPDGFRHVFHQYTIRVPNGRRDALREALTDQGIGSAVYYPVPVHRQQVYKERGYDDVHPESERAAEEVLSLPVHPAVGRDDLEAIVAVVNRFVRAQ